MTGFDVAVVGAGVHGASAAFHLASRGVKTVVFERDVPAGGPTGRSSAICRAYYTNEFLARVARDSITMFERFAEITNGRDAEFRRTGILVLHPPEDEAQVREVVPRLNDQGIPTDLLNRKQLATEFPAFDLEGIGIGAFERDAGYADPAGTTVGLLQRAVELGAETWVGHAVAAIDADHEGWAVVTTDGSRTACGRVLIAAGPWTRSLAARVGADIPLHVERHVVATYAWGGADPVPAHADLPGGYYFRPEGEELFLVGPLLPEPDADPDDYPEAIAAEEARELGERVVRRIPSLERAESRGGWASLYDVSPDWQPVIGEIAPGVFVDAGTSGHGFKLAPALGGHVADLVMGGEVDPGLAQFDPRRFTEHRELAAGYGAARILG